MRLNAAVGGRVGMGEDVHRRHWLAQAGQAVVALAAASGGLAHASQYDDYVRAIISDNERAMVNLIFRGFDPNTRDYREYAGGPLSDIGAHHFDIAQWAMNEDAGGPVKVTPPEDPNATHGLVYDYASGIRMHHDNKRGRSGCLFVGTEGELYVDRKTIESTPDGILKSPLGPNDFHLPPIAKKHQQNWLDCVRTGERPVADVEIGHRTNTVCMLANIAYQLDRPLKWNPKTERFHEDAEADSLILQPDRAPWSGIAV